MTRSGFVAVAGRPNVGKSTLVNALVGAKVAVTSDKPQTTRRAIRGIVNGTRDGEPYQLVLVDLPGVQSPRDELTERMQKRVERELADCDAALFVINAAERSGGGDRFIAAALAAAKLPVVVAVNKVDLADHAKTAAALAGAGELEQEGVDVREIVPVSALKGSGVETLRAALTAQLPEGPLYFPPEDVSDQPLNVRLAELVREAALKRTREEIPHSIEVHVEDVARREDGLTVVRAVLWVESNSQKSILIGRAGAMVRSIGTSARKEIEREVGSRAHLDLTVKVRKGWRRDDGLLDRLGIEA
ncbi:MAG TPA: GTPase Era [Solirubrobacterales bacterium]|nr:GTPase Era [Solirubrobacterales bacterium]